MNVAKEKVSLLGTPVQETCMGGKTFFSKKGYRGFRKFACILDVFFVAYTGAY